MTDDTDNTERTEAKLEEAEINATRRVRGTVILALHDEVCAAVEDAFGPDLDDDEFDRLVALVKDRVPLV